jgi:hypothetical protein
MIVAQAEPIGNDRALTGASAGSPASAPAPTPHLAQSAARQIALALVRGVDPHTGTITVRLQPHELGSLELRVALQPGGMHVQVIAERRETYESLVSGRPEIERQLAESGVFLGNGGLDFRHGGGEQAAKNPAALPVSLPAAPPASAPTRPTAPHQARGLLDILA